jgi:hypothetical protein
MERAPLLGLRLCSRANARPRRDVDGDGDGSMSWPYSPLAPYAGVVSRSWCPTPSLRTAWSTGSLDVSRMKIGQHRVVLLNVVGDVSSQAWPVTPMGRVETCLLPSSVRSVTPDSSSHINSDGRWCGPPCWLAPVPLGWGEVELAPPRSDEAESTPPGVRQVGACALGSDEVATTPLNRPN